MALINFSCLSFFLLVSLSLLIRSNVGGGQKYSFVLNLSEFFSALAQDKSNFFIHCHDVASLSCCAVLCGKQQAISRGTRKKKVMGKLPVTGILHKR